MVKEIINVVLGKSDSPRGEMSKDDWGHLIRTGAIAVLSYLATDALPMLTGHSWKFDGKDYTAEVALTITVGGVFLRRILAGLKDKEAPKKS